MQQYNEYTGNMIESAELSQARLIAPSEAELTGLLYSLYRLIDQQQNQILRQQEQLRRMSAEIMLEGRWRPKDHAREILGFTKQCYVVGCYDFAPGSELEIREDMQSLHLRLAIASCLDSCFAESYGSCSCETEDCLGTLLLNVPKFGGDAWQEKEFLTCGRRAVEHIREKCGVEIQLSLSFCYNEIAKLPIALAEAKRILRLQKLTEGADRLLYAGKLELYGPQGIEDIPGLEEALYHCAGKAELDQVNRLLNRLAQAKIREAHNIEELSLKTAEWLETVHKGLGLERRGEECLFSAREKLKNANFPDEFLLIMAEYCLDAHELLILLEPYESQVKSEALPSLVMDYIDRRYTNCNLNLAMIAGHFRCSDNRISKVFKSSTGIGVLDYIQRQRIKKACSLLAGTDMSVDEILAQAGYTNRRTFNRVFSRHTGTTPLRYRAKYQSDSREKYQVPSGMVNNI